jgi:hypothetical protein
MLKSKAFLAKYSHFIEEKKEEYHAEILTQQGFFNTISFKVKFDLTLSTETIKYPFQELTNDLKSNLKNRLAIVEELKRANQSAGKHQRHLKTF